MKAHRFQEKYTGVQILVWHCICESNARRELSKVVINTDNWVYLGQSQII